MKITKERFRIFQANDIDKLIGVVEGFTERVESEQGKVFAVQTHCHPNNAPRPKSWPKTRAWLVYLAVVFFKYTEEVEEDEEETETETPEPKPVPKKVPNAAAFFATAESKPEEVAKSVPKPEPKKHKKRFEPARELWMTCSVNGCMQRQKYSTFFACKNNHASPPMTLEEACYKCGKKFADASVKQCMFCGNTERMTDKDRYWSIWELV